MMKSCWWHRHFQTEESKQHYVEQFAENFIPDGSRLVFQKDSNVSGDYTAMDEKNHMEYLIDLDPVNREYTFLSEAVFSSGVAK